MACASESGGLRPVTRLISMYKMRTQHNALCKLVGVVRPT